MQWERPGPTLQSIWETNFSFCLIFILFYFKERMVKENRLADKSVRVILKGVEREVLNMLKICEILKELVKY